MGIEALENFGWTIELAIPSASDGWGQIESPSKYNIDKIEEPLKNIH